MPMDSETTTNLRKLGTSQIPIVKDETKLQNENISGKIWNRLTQPLTQLNSNLVFVIDDVTILP